MGPGRSPAHPAAPHRGTPPRPASISRRCTSPAAARELESLSLTPTTPTLTLTLTLTLTPTLTQVHPVLRQLEVVLSTTSFFLSFFVLFWVRESMHAGRASMLRVPPGWCHRALPRPRVLG